MSKMIREICEDKGIKLMDGKTDREYDADCSKYEDNEVTREIFEKDMLLHFENLDFDTYYKLRMLELLKSIDEKLEDLEMLYDVQRQIENIARLKQEGVTKYGNDKRFFYFN